jgi:hypothetical protein
MTNQIQITMNLGKYLFVVVGNITIWYRNLRWNVRLCSDFLLFNFRFKQSSWLILSILVLRSLNVSLFIYLTLGYILLTYLSNLLVLYIHLLRLCLLILKKLWGILLDENILTIKMNLFYENSVTFNWSVIIMKS